MNAVWCYAQGLFSRTDITRNTRVYRQSVVKFVVVQCDASFSTAMNGKTNVVPIKWKIAVTILLLLCVGLLIALVVIAIDFVQYKDKYPGKQEHEDCGDGLLNEGELPKSQAIFKDLTSDELLAARDFMLKQSALGLKRIDNASVSDNYIYMIQLLTPEKEAALEYLDNNKPKPAKRAVVVVFQGSAIPPVVQEYIVSWPNNSGEMTYEKRGKPLDFNVRPYDLVQQKAIEKIVLEQTSKAFQLLNESYDGYCYYNCTNKLLKFRPQTPFGKTRDERTTWLQFTRDVEGSYLNPVDFQLFIDFAGSDFSKWKMKKVYYNGVTFDSIDDLVHQYNTGNIAKSFIPAPQVQYDGDKPLFSSYARRGIPQPQKPMRAPRMFEPDGQRFSVIGRHVKYMAWSFDFRIDSVSGPQLFDIRFNDKRIVYELSLQEAISFYSGYSPYFRSANFVYGGWVMGAKIVELVGGVDCPATSIFFDVEHFVDSNNPKTVRNAVCVFELDSAIPLRRHFETVGKSGYKFYGGLVSYVLVLRTITTIDNYDSIFDFMFYPNGVIEVKATPTGYILTENYKSGQDDYGKKVHDKLVGNLHDHIFHYKVDLDVHQRYNTFRTIEIKTANKQSSWPPADNRILKVFEEKDIRNEVDAKFQTIDFNKPTFYNIYGNEVNKFGSKKGYLIQSQSAVKQVLPVSDYITKMAPWSIYPLVVTKYRATEPKSSSLYNQNSPTRPIVDFPNFETQQNEGILNQDLVAWLSIGSIQIPTSEDVPNVASAANGARFFLRPFNYFDEDPSIASTNAVVIRPARNNNLVQTFGTPSEEKVCVPRKYDVDIKGAYESGDGRLT